MNYKEPSKPVINDWSLEQARKAASIAAQKALLDLTQELSTMNQMYHFNPDYPLQMIGKVMAKLNQIRFDLKALKS